MNNVIVYTAIFGGKDRLMDVKKQSGVDYVCFTDNKFLKSPTWEILPIKPDPFKSFRMQAKIYKILPHFYFPNYEHSLWVDGNITPISDIKILIKEYLKDVSIVMFTHEYRSCIYEEAAACTERKKDSSDIIKKHMERYLAENYPKDNGLVANGILLRKHNDPKLIKTMEIWWNELNIGSSRDQLSFIYSTWKTGLKFGLFPGLRENSPFFKSSEHLRKK